MKVLYSISFSVPRCSRPICGSTRSTTSPSSSSTRRSTPCAAGCCGPKFSVKLRSSATDVCSHRHVFQLGLITIVLADHTRHECAWLYGNRLINHATLGRIVFHFDVADEREVLPEGMTDETVVGQQAPQVRMSVEEDAEKIER